MSRVITVLMDLPPENDSHRYTIDALGHAIDATSADITVRVVATDAIDELGHGVVVGPGSPYHDARAAEGAIQTAHEKGLPLVGT